MLKKIAQFIVTAFDLLYKISSAIARILLVAMVLIISTNVFMRYVLGSGIRWGEEIALVLVGWFVFLAIPMGVRKKLHIRLHLWRRQIPLLDAILERIAALGVIGVGLVFLINGNRLIGFASRSIMPASKLPSSILYAVLPLAAILMLYEGITDLIGFETDVASTPTTKENESYPDTTAAEDDPHV
jgi:TRAP-type transport system small permease protein